MKNIWLDCILLWILIWTNLYLFYCRCGWGFQEGDQGHPDPVWQDPAGCRSTSLRVQEVRWTWSSRPLPEVLPLIHVYIFIINWRNKENKFDFIYWLALFHGYHTWLLSSYNCFFYSTDLFWLLGTCSHFLFTIAQVHSFSGKQYNRRLPVCSCICFCWQSLVLVMLLNLNHGSHIR